MFCKLASENAIDTKIGVDTLFVVEYMPHAPDNYVKVYLYGLSLASRSDSMDNDLERMARCLKIEIDEVIKAYGYWQEQGLCSLSMTTPPTVEYRAVRPAGSKVKIFKVEKFKSFNDQLNKMLPRRVILPNEYNEYYTAMDALQIEQNAMLAIVGYCVRLKGEDISWHYIVAVARNLASEGYRTFDQISEKLSDLDYSHGELVAILKALKLKRAPDHEDKTLYLKWTRQMGFTSDAIIHVAKKIKKGGITRLDSLISRYYDARLFATTEIDAYEERKDKLYGLAKKINATIGVYYEQLDMTVETYIVGWLACGFEEQALLDIATYCYRKSIRTLEGMDDAVNKFYRAGLITAAAIAGHVSQIAGVDKEIAEVLKTAGLERIVTSRDRDSYRIWTYTWQFGRDLILYAAEQSQGKTNPMSYINAILSNWREKKITTLDEAKKTSSIPSQAMAEIAATSKPNTISEYTVQQIDALFDTLEEM